MPPEPILLEKVVPQGYTLAHARGKTLFVRGGVPGERVRVRVTHRRKGVLFGIVEEVVEPSPLRSEPLCPVFLSCGGCSFLQVPYEAELRYKEEILREIFSRQAPEILERKAPLLPTLPPYFYRNKMEYSFGREQGKPVLGLHRFESHTQVVPAHTCLLQSPEAQKLILSINAWAEKRNLPIHDERTGEKGLRFLVIREGKRTGEILLHLVASCEIPGCGELLSELSVPITTFLFSMYRGKGQVVATEQGETLLGPGWIHEELNGYRFRIGPYTFFQANTRGAEALFSLIQRWAQDLGSETILDLYAGSAPIAIHLARMGKRIVAVETEREALAHARVNLELNEVENVELHCAEVERFLPSLKLPPDLVVVDPPRAGLHPRALKALCRLKPPHLFYVSCNPITFLRDYLSLRAAGYAPLKVQPLDLFPRTYHLELLVHLALQEPQTQIKNPSVPT